MTNNQQLTEAANKYCMWMADKVVRGCNTCKGYGEAISPFGAYGFSILQDCRSCTPIRDKWREKAGKYEIVDCCDNCWNCRGGECNDEMSTYYHLDVEPDGHCNQYNPDPWEGSKHTVESIRALMEDLEVWERFKEQYLEEHIQRAAFPKDKRMGGRNTAKIIAIICFDVFTDPVLLSQAATEFINSLMEGE
jgi:hypothetical protein